MKKVALGVAAFVLALLPVIAHQNDDDQTSAAQSRIDWD